MSTPRRWRLCLGLRAYSILLGSMLCLPVCNAFLVVPRGPSKSRPSGVISLSSSLISHRYSRLTRPTCLLRESLREHPSVSQDVDMDADRRKGLLVLLTVPFAWGSFEPAARYIYALDPPVPAFIFSLAYYSVAALSLFLATAIPETSPESAKQADLAGDDVSLITTSKDSWPINGGIELGSYLFAGNALQLLGLKSVPADRAAFLLQMTTLIVPLLQAAYARDLSAVRAKTWLACVVALVGVLVIGLDGDTSASLDALDVTTVLSSTGLSSGDFLVLAAAVAYSFHCIRLEGYAKKSSAVKLAASKAATEAFWTLFAVTVLLGYFRSSSSAATITAGTSFESFALETGRETSDFISYLTDGLASGSITFDVLWPAFVAILWTGLVTVAYTIYAQSYGQRRIEPATANLIYTFQPVCTALLAWLLLGESLTKVGYVGGALIGAAVLIEVIPARASQDYS